MNESNEIVGQIIGMTIVISFLVILLVLLSFFLRQETVALAAKTYGLEVVYAEYSKCDNFRQEQNKCLYETRATDYERCYWQAQK